MPVLSEKRMVVLTGLSRRCGAFDSVAAEAVGVNSPSHTIPLACAARKPGCLPKSVFIVSTICSGTDFSGSSARATPPKKAAAPIPRRISRRSYRLLSRFIGTSAFLASERESAGDRPYCRLVYGSSDRSPMPWNRRV